MREIWIIVLVGLSWQSALGRLGETSQEIEKRYGAAISSGSLPGFTQCMYEKQSFAIIVFYKDGVSVLEKFAKRGLDQETARKVVMLVAATAIGCPDAAQEALIRQAAGITAKDEVFWSWTNAGQGVEAAFNPIECALTFFEDPAVYASVQDALASTPLGGD